MAGDAICLVGLRGSGKSTVGAALARALGRPFLDLDRALEDRAGRTLRELFADPGEEAFRALEAEVLREALRLLPRAVLATGGGVVLRPENREALRAASVVWLHARPEVLAARVAADPRSLQDRPALGPGGPLAEARRLLGEREPLYREVAQLVVDAEGSVEEVVAAIRSGLAAAAPTRRPAP